MFMIQYNIVFFDLQTLVVLGRRGDVELWADLQLALGHCIPLFVLAQWSGFSVLAVASVPQYAAKGRT